MLGYFVIRHYIKHVTTSPEPQPTAPWTRSLVLVALCVLLFYVHRQIHTYVTAQDPFWYVALARQVLFDRIIASDLAPGLSFVSPGFPLLLAFVIKLFGPYAPYEMNFVLGVAFFISYAAMLRSLFNNARSEAIILCTTLFLLIGSYGYNAHFLLYPFRGMPIYFLIFLGYALVLRARKRSNPHLFYAGLPFVAAIAIREPAVFSAAGAALFVLLDGGLRNRAAWKRVAWFSAPLVSAALLLVVFGATRGKPMNHQFQSWSERLMTKPPDQLVTEILGAAHLMAVWLTQSITWIGLLLTAAGLWRLRRNKAILCFFVLPAAIFFAFYCLYVPHRRYFLTILVLLSPVLGAGLAWLIESLPKRIPTFASAALCLALLGGVLVQAHSLTPWGRNVDREAVREFRREMEVVAPGNAIAFHEPACRYLADALTCFTHLSLPDPMQISSALQSGREAVYLEPLDEGCYYEGYIDGSLGPTGISMRNALTFYADLTPVPGDRQKIRTFEFAEGTFAVHNIAPWTHTTVQAYQLVPHSHPAVVWLDFGERLPTPASIRVSSPDETVLSEWTVPQARHIMGFALPGDKVASGHLIVTATAEQPLCADPLIGIQSGDTPMTFPLDTNRSLSTHYWLRPPFAQPWPNHPTPAILANEGLLSLPIPFGDNYQKLQIGLVLDVRPQSPEGAMLSVFHGEHQLLETKIDPALRTFKRVFEVARPEGTAHLNLSLTTNIEAPTQIRVVAVTIAPIDWVPTAQ